MKVFVTGATGVLGRPVVRRLYTAGHEVAALCRSDANRRTLGALGVRPVTADLFDPDDMGRAIDGFDAVLHLATRIPRVGQMGRRGAWTENDRIRRDGTKAIRQAARRGSTVRTLLYPSVTFFYADAGDAWLDATNARTEPCHPLESALQAEAEVAAFADDTPDRRGVVLRFGAFYGPASNDARQSLAMARKGVVLPIAPGGAYRSAIWIDDAASAVVAALDSRVSGVFDVVEDDPATQAQTMAALAQAVGRRRLRPLPRWLLRLALPGDLRTLLARSQRISNARFRDAAGWRPFVANQQEGWLRMAASE